jgi:hypothetical protein
MKAQTKKPGGVSPLPNPRNRAKVGKVAWGIVFACLALSVLLFVVDAISRHRFVEKISSVSFSEVRRHSLPIPPGTREEYLVLPFSSMDARWWVLHTERLMGEGGGRVRHTPTDNAPQGREVHWSSLLMWLLAILSNIRSAYGGSPATDHIAESAMIAGPVMLALFLACLCLMANRRFGRFNAGFFALALLTSFPLLITFSAGETDHHGPVACFSVASLLCIIAGGTGFVAIKSRRDSKSAQEPDADLILDEASAKNWFVASGVFGAAALWVSAATAIPVLFGAVIGGAFAGFFERDKADSRVLRPNLWFSWAISGCCASIGFYLLEYFPGNMGIRLEVNHPLYAFAWLGAGFLMSRGLTLLKSGNQKARAKIGWFPIALSALAAAAPAIAIYLAKGSIFWVSDTFLLDLHKEYISEFQNIFKMNQISGQGFYWVTVYLWPFLAIILGTLLLARGALGDFGRRSLFFLAPPTAVMQILTIIQVRWASAAFPLWALCALAITVDLTLCGDRQRPVRRWAFRTVLAGCLAAFFLSLFPQIFFRIMDEETCLDPPLKKEIASNLLLRDIAHRLIQASPDKIPTVLTGPNSSTEMAYHAKIRVLGTLYWENMPGLKRAARIFSVPDEKTALAELLAAGVTHIVVPSWDNFGEAYANLLAKAEGKGKGDTPFFKSVLAGECCPIWLRPFAYPIPTNSGLDTTSVKIFAVLPEQNEFESFLFRGIYHFESNEPEKAKPLFERARDLRPSDPRVRDYLLKL